MTVIGYTTGVYDVFHIGHLNVIRRASLECDRLIVGVTTDELAESRKGARPVVPWTERAEIVAQLRYVDDVVAQDSMDKIAAWKEQRFHVMFVGDDWQGTPTWDRLERDFAQVGVTIRYFPYTRHTSSTALRSRLSQAAGA